jgi:hypothetical protein
LKRQVPSSLRLREVAIPFAVGGDHSVPNGTFRGIIDVYGRKNVAFLHFDAHLYRGTGKLHFLTGVAMKQRGLEPDYVHPRVAGQP